MPLALVFIDTWPSELQDAVVAVFGALQDVKEGDLPTGTINLKLVDDAESARLNKEYTGNAYATDVLTFNYAEDGDVVDGELADIAISRETAAIQAHQAGTSLPDEVALLAIHGILHVLGHDHQEAASQTELNDLQKQLIESANLTYREFTWND